MAATARTTFNPMAEVPKAEFYATIKGPNYDNIWVKNEHIHEELAL